MKKIIFLLAAFLTGSHQLTAQTEPAFRKTFIPDPAWRCEAQVTTPTPNQAKTRKAFDVEKERSFFIDSIQVYQSLSGKTHFVKAFSKSEVLSFEFTDKSEMALFMDDDGGRVIFLKIENGQMIDQMIIYTRLKSQFDKIWLFGQNVFKFFEKEEPVEVTVMQ